MALHSQLPIYKVTYDLTVLVAEITRSFPRDFKASLGGKLRDLCIDMVMQIYRANCAAEKVPHLRQLIEQVQVTELQLRLSLDMRFISPAQYGRAIQLTDLIGKQANGWRKKYATSPAA